MIPRRYIEEWKAFAPWPNDAQVEQDLIIERALVEMAPSSGHYTKEEKDAIYLIYIGQLSIIISILKSLFIIEKL